MHPLFHPSCNACVGIGYKHTVACEVLRKEVQDPVMADRLLSAEQQEEARRAGILPEKYTVAEGVHTSASSANPATASASSANPATASASSAHPVIVSARAETETMTDVASE
eukprot:4570777-Amphidinium_carterae.1